MKLLINGVDIEVANEEISKAIEVGQYEVKSEGIKVFKSEDFEARQKNLADAEYKKGKLAGEEIPIKEAREKFGLEFEGKTIENFAEALKKKTLSEASIEPSKRVEELSKDLEKSKLIISDWEQKYNGLNDSFAKKEKQEKINTKLLAKLPADKLTIPADDLLIVLKSKHDFDIDESGSIVIKKGGEVLKNEKNLSPLTIDEYLPTVLTPYVKQVSGGAGAGDSTGNKSGSLESFVKEMEANGVNSNSLKFQQEMQKRIKEGTLKV